MSFSAGRHPAVCLLVKTCVDIYLQAEEAPVVSCRDPGRRLEPLARLPQQVAQRPDGGDCDGAGAAGQDQHAVAPPAHVHQRVVLLLIWDGSGEGGDNTEIQNAIFQGGDAGYWLPFSSKQQTVLSMRRSGITLRPMISPSTHQGRMGQRQLLHDPSLQGHGLLTPH